MEKEGRSEQFCGRGDTAQKRKKKKTFARKNEMTGRKGSNTSENNRKRQN